MTKQAKSSDQRCTRCGRVAAETDKFCAECGFFVRDAHIDQRLLLALVREREGRSEEARYELQRLLQPEPDHVLANHLLGTFYFHQGTLELAIELCLEIDPDYKAAHEPKVTQMRDAPST
jgi:Tfp pilus assembly protein PilF